MTTTITTTTFKGGKHHSRLISTLWCEDGSRGEQTMGWRNIQSNIYWSIIY